MNARIGFTSHNRRLQRMESLTLVSLLVSMVFGLGTCYTNEDLDLLPYDVPEDTSFNFGDDQFVEYHLKSPFTFFKNTYDRVFISGNGQVSFSQGTSSFTPACSPSSIPMIMAFWADAIMYDTESKLLYRESIDRSLLRRVSLDVFKQFDDLRGIHLSWMLIVTWKDLPFYGVQPDCEGLSKRNTFQLVLITDGHHSFALMYYKRIDWTTGRASSGNCYGLGGNPAKAGFDFGDNKNIFTIPGSCNDSILNIAQTSNINSPGKYVFQIDSNLRTAECKEFDQSKRLRVSPSVVTPYGHVPLTLSGPCVSSSDKISCKYIDGDKKIKIAGMLKPYSNDVICPLPAFNRLGKKSVQIEVARTSKDKDEHHNEKDYSNSISKSAPDNGNDHSGSFYVVNVDSREIDDQLKVSFTQSPWDTNVMEVHVEWDPVYVREKLFSDVTGAWQDQMSEKNVEELDLWLERYHGQNWTQYKHLKLRHENSEGRFSGNLEKNDVQDIFHKYRPDFLTVSLSDSDSNWGGRDNWNKIYANAFTVSLNFYKVASSVHPPPPRVAERSLQNCVEWASLEDRTLDDGVRPCPPTRQLAEVDSNFEEEKPRKWLPYLHPGGVYSVRQRVPSRLGAGSQCVYRSDGSILTGYPGGGTLDKISPNHGVFQHFYHDIIPFIYCCKLSGAMSPQACERLYYSVRPSDDGSNYVRPSVSIAKGDPHITTFDGLMYTFNGVGEFWMVKMRNPPKNQTFKLQARMEQYVSMDGTPMPASVFTAFVLEEVVNDQNATLQVSYSNGGMYITIDEESVDISEDDIPETGFILSHDIYQITLYSSDNVTVSLSSGFSFHFSTVGVNETALNVIGIATDCTYDLIEGLMGNCDGYSDNDLKNAYDIVLSTLSSPEQIHKDFGLTWLVHESESLFSYPPGKSYKDYLKPSFTPHFGLSQEDFKALPENVTASCGSDPECLFDYSTTGSMALAQGTQKLNQEYDRLDEVVMTSEIKLCSSRKISPVDNGFANITSLMINGQVTFSCDDDYYLPGGPANCTCVYDEMQETSSWHCHPNIELPPRCIQGADPALSDPPTKCDEPHVPRNGFILASTYSIGSSIEIRCNNSNYELFWKNCNFNGENGLCSRNDQPCSAIFTCTIGRNRYNEVSTVWKGFPGDIRNVRCLSSRAATNARNLRRSATWIRNQSWNRYVSPSPDQIRKPPLLDC